MRWFVGDLRYAVRSLLASPGLAATAIVSLAIGIGPCSALFSIIDAFGYRPLPIADPAGLLTVETRSESSRDTGMSYPEYVDVRDGAQLLASVAVEGPLAAAFGREGTAPEVVIGSTVSANYFSTLGVQPARGRTFAADEDRIPAGDLPIVISDRLSQRLFGGHGALGATVRLNRVVARIVGVMPAGFAGTSWVFAPDFWMPIGTWPLFDRGGAAATLDARARRGLTVLARARPDTSLEQARAELAALGARLAKAWPQTNQDTRFVVAREQEARRRRVGPIAMVSFAIVSLILLVAAANVAGLLVGRSEARRDEFAIRAAVGASRTRLAGQLLAESMVLAVAAAALGLALAFWMLRALPALVPPMPIPVSFDFRVDLRLVVFTAAMVALMVPLLGLAPALLASRRDLAWRVHGRTSSAGRRRFRDALLAVQVAVTLVLLTGAGLLLRGLANASDVDAGFTPRPMVFATMSPGILGYDEARTRDFYRQLLERLSSSPGIASATMVRHMPLNTLYGGGARMDVAVPGRPDPGEVPVSVRFNTVGADYFETMGTRIVRGRAFTKEDAPGGPAVAIVNQHMARELWPGADPIGRHVRVKLPGKGAVSREVEVVGLAQDGRYLRLTEAPQSYLFLPWAQQYTSEMTVVARYSGSLDEAAGSFRRAVAAVDPAMPTLRLTTLDEHLRLALIFERVGVWVGLTLGGLGLVLSVIGLYGVVSFLVSRRTREMGIRTALGAAPGQLVRVVVVQGGRGALAGMMIGLPLAYAAGRVIAADLYAVSPNDPLVLGGAAAIVLLVALLGAWVPARRAAQVDPVSALRGDG